MHEANMLQQIPHIFTIGCFLAWCCGLPATKNSVTREIWVHRHPAVARIATCKHRDEQFIVGVHGGRIHCERCLVSATDLQPHSGIRNSNDCTFEVLETVDRLDQPGFPMEFAACAPLLRCCAESMDLFRGQRVHDHINRNGLEQSAFIGALLVNMYLKCGTVEDAQTVFYKLNRRNVFSWNLMIRSYTGQGQGDEALQCFVRMQGEGAVPDKHTFAGLLNACVSLKDGAEARRIHVRITDTILESDVGVENVLVNVYGKCGSLEDARRVFDRMPERDTVSWNSLIVAFVQHGVGKGASHLFVDMQQQGVLPSRITFVSILDACTTHTDIAEGERLHARVLGSGYEEDVVVATVLLSMYSKCGRKQDAWRMFYKMPERNLVSWNAMIKACDDLGQTIEITQLYTRLLGEGILPNTVTFISILSTCSSPPDLFKGEQMHVYVIGCGYQADIDVSNALMSMYSKCGSLKDAHRIFHQMPGKNTISWTTLITAHVEQGQSKQAIQLFHQMQGEGILADKVTFISLLCACASLNSIARGRQMHCRILGGEFESSFGVGSAIVSMYGKCGSLKDVWRMIDELPNHDLITWTALISAHAQQGHANKAIQLFYQMQHEGIVPNKVTYITVLDACAEEAALFEGRRLHSHVIANGFESDELVGTAFVDMYGKCGNLQDSQRTFDKVPKQDVVLWTVLIAAYAQNGKCDEALKLFDQMQIKGVSPDKVTFINVLSVCSHAGLVHEACRYFSSMSCHNIVSPTVEHYSCMVDMFGRAGCLNEAEKLIANVPSPPSALLWMTLLGACRYQLDVDRGERAARHVFQLDPENPAPYVMLSNIYAAADRGADAAKVIIKMREKF